MSRKHERKRAVEAEVAQIDLGDPRREARAQLVTGRLAQAGGKSLPGAMLSEAELEGAYRHLSSQHVTLRDIVSPHVLKTRQRILETGCAYVLHDTTDFTLGGQTRRAGLGPVQGGDQGFLAHVSFAVSCDGERTPLGLLSVGTRVRPQVGAPTGQERHKWRKGVESSALELPLQSLIHVGDRETDIFEVLCWMQGEGRRFIFRAAQDRSVLGEAGQAQRLFAAVCAEQPLHEVGVELGARGHGGRAAKDVKRHPVRRTRQARLAYSAQRLTLRRPQKASKQLPASLTLNVVRAWEPHPPEGQPAVEWLLFTSEPVASAADVVRVVDGYRTRWVIEEFFKTLKSGLAYESSQLESAHALFNLLGYCLIIAYGMLLLRALSRTKTSLPADAFFTPAQLACLRAFSKRVKLPAQPALPEALLAVAGLGGHLKRNGLPGWKTLSSGYSQLLAYEQGFLAAQRLTSDQS